MGKLCTQEEDEFNANLLLLVLREAQTGRLLSCGTSLRSAMEHEGWNTPGFDWSAFDNHDGGFSALDWRSVGHIDDWPTRWLRLIKKALREWFGLRFIPRDTFHHRGKIHAGMSIQKYEKLATSYSYNPKDGTFTNRHGRKVGFKNSSGYIVFSGGVLAHRLAWYITHGVVPKVVDHINHKRDDNRIANLRNTTQGDNCRNRSDSGDMLNISTDNRSGKYRVIVSHDGKTKRLGVYLSLDKAKEVRDKAHEAISEGRWGDVEETPLRTANTGERHIRRIKNRLCVIMGPTVREKRNGYTNPIRVGWFGLGEMQDAIDCRERAIRLREEGRHPKTGEVLVFE